MSLKCGCELSLSTEHNSRKSYFAGTDRRIGAVLEGLRV